jgi:hypothetical protein
MTIDRAAASFLFLQSARRSVPQVFSRLPQGMRVDVASQYELDDIDDAALHGYAALLLTSHLDQIHFERRRDRIEGYLDSAGMIVFNGPIVRPFLPELRPFVPLPKRTLETLRVCRFASHPAFPDIAVERLSLRRGVAGFWGRGHNPPPPGATLIHGLGPERAPVDWEWRRPAGGTVLCHAGNDIWGFLEDEPDADALPLGVLGWLASMEKTV